MLSVPLFFYFGIFLAIVGSIATAWGPGVNDPIVRTFNTEVASIGVCLVLLCYNHVLALLTLLATTVVISLILSIPFNIAVSLSNSILLSHSSLKAG